LRSLVFDRLSKPSICQLLAAIQAVASGAILVADGDKAGILSILF
jgi:hypothetical protein